MQGHLASLLLIAGPVLAQLICKDYLPHDWTTPYARIMPANESTLGGSGTYMTTSSPWTVNTNSTSQGAIFHIKSCTDASLGVGPEEDDMCAGTSGYSQTYYENIQIIDPSTGHCLTQVNFAASPTLLNFQACNKNPQNVGQLFAADSSVEYDFTCGGCDGCSPAQTSWNSYSIPVNGMRHAQNFDDFYNFEILKDGKTMSLNYDTDNLGWVLLKPVGSLFNGGN